MFKIGDKVVPSSEEDMNNDLRECWSAAKQGYLEVTEVDTSNGRNPNQVLIRIQPVGRVVYAYRLKLYASSVPAFSLPDDLFIIEV